MKHIRFIDSKVEAFIKCRKILKFHFGWKRKLKLINNIGEIITVFYNPNFSSEIMVKNLGPNKNSHLNEYEFIYSDGTHEYESCKFSCIAYSFLYAIDSSVEDAYTIYSSHTFTDDELITAYNLEEVDQKFKFATIERTKTKYDWKDDYVGQKEVVRVKDLFIKYKGYNKESKRKEFVFSVDNKECKCMFEITD